jgi:hypothetical protein
MRRDGNLTIFNITYSRCRRVLLAILIIVGIWLVGSRWFIEEPLRLNAFGEIRV